MHARINDPSRTLFAYMHSAQGTWVTCPKCSAPAKVELDVSEDRTHFSNANLTCTQCFNRISRELPYRPRGSWCHGCHTQIAIELPLPKQIGMGIGPPNRRQGCEACKRIKRGCDPVFGLPFFLTAAIGGKEIWAVNRQHLCDMKAYLGATLRERNPWIGLSLTAMARLPAWVRAASSRPRVLRALQKLIAQADLHRLP